jgi:hypothetical protein
MDQEGQKVNDPEGQKVKDSEHQKVKDPEGQKVKDPEGQKVKDLEGQKVKDPEGQKVKDPEGQKVKDPEGQKKQGFGSGSRLDPNLIGPLDPDPESGSGSRRAKMTHKVENFFLKVHVLKCWMASFES